MRADCPARSTMFEVEHIFKHLVGQDFNYSLSQKKAQKCDLPETFSKYLPSNSRTPSLIKNAYTLTKI